jgi:anti-sigma factor RsiW
LKKQDIYGKITAYADNELKNVQDVSQVEKLIENDPECRNELQIQQMMKSLVKQRYQPKPTPDFVREAILRKTVKQKKRRRALPLSLELFKPPYSIAIALTVILMIIVATYYTTILIKTMAPENMSVQARINFEALLARELSIQFVSSNAADVQKFFAEQGVVYKTQVPVFSKWQLIGGIVSIDNGVKFAQQVYASKDGKTLVYIFQTDESMIYERKILSLPEEVTKRMASAGYFERDEGGISTIFTKCDGSIFGIITNEKPEVFGEDLRKF